MTARMQKKESFQRSATMAPSEKNNGFMDKMKTGLDMISRIISATIFPPIAEGAETVMRNIEDKIKQIEKRIMRNISSLLIIGIGGIFLSFALFFFLIEHLSWTKTASFFYVGVIIFVIGLLLKLSKPKR